MANANQYARYAMVLMLTISAQCFAMPKSIKYVEEIVLPDDTIYVVYHVTCANDTEADISSWDDNKLWCEGKGKKDVCNKKKIQTAKAVCK
jgi:hypothetical protein